MSPCWKKKSINFVHDASHIIDLKCGPGEPEEEFPSRVASKMKARRNEMVKVNSSSSKDAIENFTAKKLHGTEQLR